MSNIFSSKVAPIFIKSISKNREKLVKEKSPIAPLLKDEETTLGTVVKKRDTILGN